MPRSSRDLRKGATRTVDALWKLVGRSVKAIAPSECAATSDTQAIVPDPHEWNLL